MAELTVDLTYGTALMEAARELGKETQILEEAQAVAQLLEDEPDLHQFINYPGVSADEKKDVLKNIFEGRICDELLNFIYILVDKRRTMNFGRIIKVYKSLIEKEEGVSYGTVYSVEPLTEDRIRSFEDEVGKLLKVSVRLENEIDPKLMGGVKILVDGKIIDASFRTKFNDLRSQIKFDGGGKK
jgi:ATP synthase F1 delta subunit